MSWCITSQVHSNHVQGNVCRLPPRISLVTFTNDKKTDDSVPSEVFLGFCSEWIPMHCLAQDKQSVFFELDHKPQENARHKLA